MEKWNLEQYTNEAKNRLRSILERIGHGGYPMGEINLLSKMPEGIAYPSLDNARKIETRLWTVIEESKEKSKLLKHYNLILSLKQRGRNGFTISFNFSPDQVWKLSGNVDGE